MSLRHAFSRAITEAWSLRRAIVQPPKGLRILMYHAVGTVVPGDHKCLYSISAPVFEQQIKAMASMEQVVAVKLDQADIDDEHLSLGITFDDGYRDNLYTAVPILQKYQVPFCVFIVTGAVRSGDPLFLSSSGIRRLVTDYGAVIGSHTATHARLAECNDSDLKEELVSSKHYLENLLGQEVKSVSYPHGSVNRRVRDAAEEAGYQIGMTSRFGVNSSKIDRLLLNRIPVLAPDSLRVFRQKLCGDWDWNYWRTSTAGTK